MCQKQLKKFIDECKSFVQKHGQDKVRIVIAGDLLHNKLDISGEGYAMASQFLRELDKICMTLIIGGNHDMNMANLTRLDPLSVIFDMCEFKQTYFLDKEMGYQSGCMVDDNIVWCLYSSFDSFNKPNINEIKVNYENKLYIGLFHGEIKSSKTDAGYISENGLETKHFDGIDYCICGHIHKRQKLTYNSVNMLYVGSLIQQDHGENISKHGYIILNTNTLEYEEYDIPNDNAFYTFSINSMDDIDKNIEKLINF